MRPLGRGTSPPSSAAGKTAATTEVFDLRRVRRHRGAPGVCRLRRGGAGDAACACEFLAAQAERGRAPWMVERAGSYALPEGLTARPWTGANAIWLGAAADRRGYSAPRWGTTEEIVQECKLTVALSNV